MSPLLCALAILLAFALLPGEGPVRPGDGQRVEAVVTLGTPTGQFLAVVGGVRQADGSYQPLTDVRFRPVGGRADAWQRYARFESAVLALAQRGEDLAILLELNQEGQTQLRFVFNPLEPGRSALDVPVPALPPGLTLINIAGGAGDVPLFALAMEEDAPAAWALTGTQWQRLPALPEALAELRRPGLDLGSVGGRPIIAGRTAPDSLAAYALVDEEWLELGRVGLESEDLFLVINAESGPVMLYVYGERDQVVQMPVARYAEQDSPQPPRAVEVEFRVAEDVGAVPQPHDPRSGAVALGSLRLVRAASSDPGAGRREQFLLEVALDPATLELVGDPEAAVLQFPTVTPEEYRRLMFELVLYGLLIVALVVLFRQRPAAAGEIFPEAGVEVAPLPLRAVAGVVDLVPLLLAAGLWYGMQDWLGQVWGLVLLAGAGVIYLAHLMVAEAMTGRSLGKAMLGLKVVSLDGGRPGLRAVLLRNVLRPLDLPAAGLGMALLSPLRQRLGDLAAGTTVIRIIPPPEG